MKHKFKVGDKVKILPSATSVGVEREEVGRTGVVGSVNRNPSSTYGIIVHMDKVCNTRGYKCSWSIGNKMIELYPIKNQQLLFRFMK